MPKKRQAQTDARKSRKMNKRQLLFAHASSLNPKLRKRQKKLRRRAIGLTIVAIQIILTLVFFGMLAYINILPDKYLLIAGILLLLISAYNLVSQYSKSYKSGRVMAILLSIVTLVGSIYLAKTYNMLDSISGSSTKTEEISVIVLNSDPAQTITDAKNYTFGIHSSLDKTNTDKTITKINAKVGTTIKTSEYDDWGSLINGLYNKKVNAIILNESYRSVFEETYPDFDTDTRVIETIELKSKVSNVTSDKKVNNEPFTIYVAGNDEYGNTISVEGRNDVNIIATFNPKTRQILLVTTPRDYYITIDSLTGTTGLDKLTHAGKFGIDGSIKALDDLYGTTIDYYVKVNFTGTVDIINALGGITVNSEVDFSTSPDTAPVKYHFVVGENECDGEKALAFCRERQTFKNGDFQRGANQMIAIKAMIAKATSSAILTRYTQVLDSVSGMISTNMSASSITSLIKGTIDSSTPWTVQTYSVTGTPATKKCEIFGGNRSVVLPDYSTVNIAKDLMNKVENGEVFDVDSYVSSLTSK